MSQKKTQPSKAERAAAVRREQQRRERVRQFVVVGAIALVLAVIVGIVFFVQSGRDPAGQAATAPHGVTDKYGVVVGKASAPKTVTVYEDFQCPICHEFENTTQARMRAAVDAGRIRIDYRMVSFLDSASTTKYSSRALNAAAVVLDTSGKDVFLKFHDLLYANQPAEGSAGLTDDQLIAYAVQAGAKESAVRPGIQDNEFGPWVTQTQDQMSKAGVNGTPTVFVDGKMQSQAGLQASIDTALSAAG